MGVGVYAGVGGGGVAVCAGWHNARGWWLVESLTRA